MGVTVISRRQDYHSQSPHFGPGGAGCEEAERQGGQDHEPHGLAPMERAEIGGAGAVAKAGASILAPGEDG